MLASIAGTIATVAPVGPVLGATADGGFGVRPAHADPGDPSTRAYFKRSVAPGGSFDDQVIVTSEGDAPLSLAVSAVDALTATTTGAVYANRGDVARAAATWMTTGQAQLALPGRAQRAVSFTVHVPAGTPPGDHLAGIAFEETLAPSPGAEFSITQVIREVVGVLVEVPGSAGPFALTIGQPSATAARGGLAVAVQLGNAGQRLGRPYLVVELDGPNRVHRRLDRQLDTILPSDRVTYQLKWQVEVPPATYRLCVAGGMDGAQEAVACAPVTLGQAAAPRAPTRAAPAAVPWAWMVLLAFVAGLLVGVLAATRRGQRRGRT